MLCNNNLDNVHKLENLSLVSRKHGQEKKYFWNLICLNNILALISIIFLL